MSTTDQGEHTFADDILISGDELRGYTAGEALDRGEPVAVTGDREVTSATEGGPFVGVVMYDVANGEEVVIAGDDCEVRVEASAALDAGDAITPDGVGGFRQATADDDEVGVTNEEISSGEFGEAYLSATTGTKGI